MSKPLYDKFSLGLQEMGAALHASELHGMLVGHVCAAESASGSQRASLYETWLGPGLPDALRQALGEAGKHAEEALDEYADFDFRLLLPDDDHAIQARTDALARWCAG
ncbi:MAG: UPF0149 family protein, partial [Pseudomonadales bacterium]